MRIPTSIALALLLVACSADNTRTGVDTDSGAMLSAGSHPIETKVPYMSEVLAEMREDYKNAVSLHDAMRSSPAYGRQYALIEKYIEFLLPTIGKVERWLEAAKSGVLTDDQYKSYTQLVSEWREKSTTVFGAVGRSL